MVMIVVMVVMVMMVMTPRAKRDTKQQGTSVNPFVTPSSSTRITQGAVVVAYVVLQWCYSGVIMVL
jgi:hypothetical protein